MGSEIPRSLVCIPRITPGWMLAAFEFQPINWLGQRESVREVNVPFHTHTQRHSSMGFLTLIFTTICKDENPFFVFIFLRPFPTSQLPTLLFPFYMRIIML